MTEPPPPSLSPEQAVDLLEARHAGATAALRAALERFIRTGTPPTPTERTRFRYPELRVTWTPTGNIPFTRRAWAKFQGPGSYGTTVTQPGFFRRYLLDQLGPLVEEFGATIAVGDSAQEIPYPYVLELGDEARGEVATGELARHFPTPLLSAVGDEVADGLWAFEQGQPRPLALFDAVRVDYSLRRLVHYTGTDWRLVQPWILLTNYQRYVEQFVRWALEELANPDSPYDSLVLPGGGVVRPGLDAAAADALVAAAPWTRFQMPAYHLTRRDDAGGVTIINIGVGPSNAKNITDHLAVLRPNCWLMVGHCGGLRQSQVIGDYVLAHAYLRRDRILDDLVPPEVPIPALAEVQVALQEAAAQVTGERGEALKKRLRTGTVVTYDDRNWELRWSQERRRINLSRAIAVDMESGTLAAQGYRLRVPYGTLLCISDKPLHGEIKLPGAATAFYQRAVGEHLKIGLAALDILRGQIGSLHSRKLRSFDEPPFR
ncbi:AMP nucleosidase [Rhodovastum atsumiense]|uniref:AMP nucleosidase n=1 Tax=Rhodovastum atsumiense TaxID=504468 RepID=A0A5M6IVS4_9PROT|nr:AMP nucleosidase [Rhodovastum atsumiense]KAA5612420.1 AMP nucleosidase [Rhodovastum atsumiense]CAH2600326.1 AMP nucleosidase [Rhodovastum atsumiense]